MCKNCDTCRHIIYDGSTNAYDCHKWDELTNDDIICFEENIAGCSKWEEDTTDYEAEDEYFEKIGGFYCGR